MQKFWIFVIVSLFSSGSATAEFVDITLTEGTNAAVAASPDRSRLVLDVQGTLWSIDPTSGRGRALTDGLGDDRQPSFSPDGERIAFQSYRDGL